MQQHNMRLAELRCFINSYDKTQCVVGWYVCLSGKEQTLYATLTPTAFHHRNHK